MDAELASRAVQLGHVTPRVDGDRVFCRCGAEMDPMAGPRMGEQIRRLWWQCSRAAGHVTAAVPIPPQALLPPP